MRAAQMNKRQKREEKKHLLLQVLSVVYGSILLRDPSEISSNLPHNFNKRSFIYINSNNHRCLLLKDPQLKIKELFPL